MARLLAATGARVARRVDDVVVMVVVMTVRMGGLRLGQGLVVGHLDSLGTREDSGTWRGLVVPASVVVSGGTRGVSATCRATVAICAGVLGLKA